MANGFVCNISKLLLVSGLISFICSQLLVIPAILAMINENSKVDGFGRRPGSSLELDATRLRLPLGSTSNDKTKPPDGTFNGAPVFLKRDDTNVQSRIHCVGDNYGRDAWQHRSCRYDFLCFNTLIEEFVVFQSTADQKLARLGERRSTIKLSDVLVAGAQNHTVSIGGINQKWGNKPGEGVGRLEWQPRILPAPETLSYYMLPDDIVWTPHHSLNGANPGHLVWDDFLPVYTLLDMFGLLDRYPLLLRYVLSDNQRGLWASCDFRKDKTESCGKMMKKFAPLMWGSESPLKYTSNKSTKLIPLTSDATSSVNLVCAKAGVAGIGELTDHGISKAHGWVPEDYTTTHNHGRGADLFRFRNYMMSNMGFASRSITVPRGGKHRVVFSLHSSSIPTRNLDYKLQMETVRAGVPNALVEGVTFSGMPLREQLETVSTTSVMVTTCGGAAVTGMFLPKGASLIVYYIENGGVRGYQRTYTPAMLDWDLLNSLSHLHVTWMPQNTRKSDVDLETLVSVIRNEFERIENGGVL